MTRESFLLSKVLFADNSLSNLIILRVTTRKTFNFCSVPYTFYPAPCFLNSEHLTLGRKKSKRIDITYLLEVSVLLPD